MLIELKVGRGGFRRWHQVLADDLRHRLPGAMVKFRLTSQAPFSLPALDALLALERLVLRGARQPLFDLIPAPDPTGEDDFVAEVILDCTGQPSEEQSGAVPILRPLFDGSPTTEALIGALLMRRMPHLGIESASSGAILAQATISAEAATGLAGGIESVLSRTIALFIRVLASPDGFLAGGAALPAADPPTSLRVIAFVTRNLAFHCARAIYHLCLLAPHWRVGWRIHDGPGVFERGDLAGPRWTILADPGSRFFADPFPVTWEGKTYLFLEDFDHRSGKGAISAVVFGDAGPTGEVVRVLEEPWHLSYPFLIEHGGALWMVPESSLSGQVPIYRCIEFPHRWERAGTLLDGFEAADSTIFRHAGRFWMTAAIREGRGGYSDMLGIFHAETLLGPWHEHRLHPVLIDVAAARPAGTVIAHHGQLWRPIQDCSRGYGKALALARIDRLDTDHFSQSVVARIEPGARWPGGRLHTLNRSGRLECIDGTTYNPRLGALRPLAGPRLSPGRRPASENAA